MADPNKEIRRQQERRQVLLVIEKVSRDIEILSSMYNYLKIKAVKTSKIIEQAPSKEEGVIATKLLVFQNAALCCSTSSIRPILRTLLVSTRLPQEERARIVIVRDQIGVQMQGIKGLHFWDDFKEVVEDFIEQLENDELFPAKDRLYELDGVAKQTDVILFDEEIPGSGSSWEQQDMTTSTISKLAPEEKSIFTKEQKGKGKAVETGPLVLTNALHQRTSNYRTPNVYHAPPSPSSG